MRTSRIDPPTVRPRLRECALATALCMVLPCAAMAEPSPQTAADVIAEHALAQQGFAIALASNVLQSHVLYVDEVTGGGSDGTWSGVCDALDDADLHSGGIKATASPPLPGHDFPGVVHVEIFYDGACAKRYMAADVMLTQTGTVASPTYSVANLATQYYAIDGATPLASLVTTASVTIPEDGSLHLHGLGHLVGAAGSQVSANLGLVCNAAAGAEALPCAGGIAQDFATLGVAIGSVSPLTLTGQDDDSLDFASTSPAAFYSSSPGGLSLGYLDATDAALKITGGNAYGSDQVSGHVATFSLLPPPPTAWTSSDAAHDLRFDISVTSATTRSLDVTIKRISSGTTRASGHLDQSGTGTITFSDGSNAPVRSWVMGEGGDAIFGNGFE